MTEESRLITKEELDYYKDSIETLKEQLKEAVDFIEELADDCEHEGIWDYLRREELEKIKKWGVK